jgi:O-antigen/teichoic acid export membrane protein
MLNQLSRLLRLRFVRDLATLQIGQIFSMGCGMLTSILYARFLGLEGYGLYAVVLALTGMIGPFTNLGQQQTTLTFFAEAYGRKDAAGMRSVLRYYICAAAIASAFLILIMPLLPVIAQHLYGSARIGKLAMIVFLSTILDTPLIFFCMALQILRRMKTLTIFENTQTSFQLCLSTVLLVSGWGVVGILASSAIASLTFSTIALLLYPKVARAEGLPSIASTLRGGRVRELLGFGKNGFWIAIDKNLGNLYPNFFLFIFSTVAPAPVLGLVRVGFKLAGLPTSLGLSSISRLTSSIIPTLAGKGMDLLRKNIRRLFGHAVLLHTSISVAAAVAIPVLLPLLYGKAFGVAMYPFFIMLTLNLLLPLHAVITPLLRTFSKTRIAATLSLLAITAGSAFFFLSPATITPLHRLYIALALYHAINALIALPVLGILRKERSLILPTGR